MWAHLLNTEDYQRLINRNWRRSGHYIYKPNTLETCCTMYTIKTDVLDFHLSRSHKKVIKRVNKFLKDGIKDKIPENAEKEYNQRANDVATEMIPRSKTIIDDQLFSIPVSSSLKAQNYEKATTSNAGCGTENSEFFHVE